MTDNETTTTVQEAVTPPAADTAAATVAETAALAQQPAAEPAKQVAATPPAEPKTEDTGKAAAPKVEEKAEPAADPLATMKQQLIRAELRAAGAAEGIPADKLTYLEKLCDMSAASAEGADIGALAKEQVSKVLGDLPLLKGGSPDTGSFANPRREAQVSETQKAQADFARGLKG